MIPARGGSKGLPGKNIRPLCGLPLIAHSIKLAKLCPEVTRVIVSTDSPEIAAVAKTHGAEAPFLRPSELAQADTPMWPVLKHALANAGGDYDALLLLDPTSPTRLPSDVSAAVRMLDGVDGIVAVSKPEFSPIWHSVVEKDGLMADLLDGSRYNSRQEVPAVYRINGLLYLWRADFVRTADAWRNRGRHRMLELPDLRAVSIDDLEQFEKTEALIKAGLIKLPWL